MPDPTILESFTTAAVELFKKNATDVEQRILEIANKATAAGFSIDSFKESLLKAGVSVKEITRIFDNYSLSVGKVGEIFEKLSRGVDISGFIENNSKAIGAAVRAFAPINDELTNVLNKYKSTSATFGIGLEDTIKTISKHSEILNKLPGLGTILGGLGKIGAGADQAKMMENTFLSVSAAAGDLGGTLRNTLGESFENLDAKMEEFNGLIADVGTSTGISANEAMDYALRLKQIPGSMTEMVRVSTESTKSISMLDATIRVARGTMQDVGGVISTLNDIFRTLGTTGDKSLQVIARMYEVSQAIKMPTDLMKTYVMGAANSFKFLGDNSQGAMDVMSRMSGAMREAGMGPAAVQEIVSGYVSGIEKMSIAQKAFISGRAGGAGGLRGGFEIDLMFREGRLNEVANKVETAMKGMFGGRVVTLEDAAKSASAASQMVKQVELLKSFGLAATQDQAYGVIESLAKGKPVPETRTPEKAVEDAVTKGNALITRQNTVVTQIANELIRLNNSASIQTGALLRLVLGSEGAAGSPIARARREGEVSAAGTGFRFSASPGLAPGAGMATGAKNLYEQGKDAIDAIKTIATSDIGKGMAAAGVNISSAVSNITGKARGAATAMAGQTDFMEELHREQTERAKSPIIPGVSVTEMPEPAAAIRRTVETAAERRPTTEPTIGRAIGEARGAGGPETITIHINTTLDKDTWLEIDKRTGEVRRKESLAHAGPGVVT